MQLRSSQFNLTGSSADCLIVFINKDSELISSSAKEQSDMRSIIEMVNQTGALKDKDHSTVFVPVNNLNQIKSLLIYRLVEPELATQDLNKTAMTIGKKLLDLDMAQIAIDIEGLSAGEADFAQELALAIIYSGYRFETCKSKKTDDRKIKEVCFWHSEDISKSIHSGKSIAEGMNLTRDLGNLPGNICTPLYLSSKAQDLQDEYAIETEILGEPEMEELGMGSLLSVSAGSVEPAQLIVMKYFGAESKEEKPYALVGKGVTFDTGGISLKPGGAMDEMKFDMCGAASVFGTVLTIAKLKLPINLVAIVAAAENMPSGCATKPGDIVTSMSGQTIEILNTDAEGRLVLCDALTYVAKYQPKTIVDIATLTGACIVALGSHASGMYSNDEQLASDILSSAQRTGDKAWRMPLWSEYDKQLKSNFADMANIGGREAGSVTAACFLARFVKDQKWAHLDIAGTAWKSGGAKGATGRPVRLLVDYLASR